MNSWGLINAIGNVAELVDDGGRASVAGGSYRDESGQCNPGARKPYTGADPLVGFRLLRELD